MKKAWRRVLLIGVLLFVALVAAMPWIIAQTGGAFADEPAALESLSPAARALVERAYEGIEPGRLADYHVHMVALGTETVGAFVNPAMRTWRHPMRRFRFLVYLSAAGVRDLENADAAYRDRFLGLIDNLPHPGRSLLLAFDRHVGRDGAFNDNKTEFYLPNDVVIDLAESDPARLAAAASVHPYRIDAVAELERCAARGVRVVKWLPNAMGIDPASDRCDAFYAAMKRLGLTLLTHGGEEKAVEAEADQVLGSPARLRRALDAGVKVIVAHAASLGSNSDGNGRVRDNFDLFLALMDEPRYRGLVFGEISATAQFNRLSQPLLTLLEREDLHARLVNGSDYPLPAVNFLIHTGTLRDLGLLTDDERDALNEIYRSNPLLFDFVLKRTLRHPRTRRGFAASVFYEHAAVPLR
ncbi:MAG: amidohydrolase [Planctomycetota bacterium]|nr:amidohydrolase [Planctomycetota bacterium]